jgi:hypothetical protein
MAHNIFYIFNIFKHKINELFFKTYFTKSVKMLKLHPYIINHVRDPSYKVTTLIFMYDICYIFV